MGQDKAAILLGGRSLLQWVADAASEVAGELIVAAAAGQALPAIEVPVPVSIRRDTQAYPGPLSALVAALDDVSAPVALVLACDQPFVRPALLRLVAAHAAGHPSVVPVFEERPQPLCAAVRREAASSLRAFIATGARDARALTRLPGSLLLPPETWRSADPDARSFIGVNTPEQLAAAEALLARGG